MDIVSFPEFAEKFARFEVPQPCPLVAASAEEPVTVARKTDDVGCAGTN
jgi:hypothetical protein